MREDYVSTIKLWVPRKCLFKCWVNIPVPSFGKIAVAVAVVPAAVAGIIITKALRNQYHHKEVVVVARQNII